MNWTEERVELLKKLWADGLSASQIAAQLGGVSRNAVIGKVHRLKLSGRARSTSSAPRAKKSPRAGAAGRSRTGGRTVSAPTIGATALKPQFQTITVAEPELNPIEDVVAPTPLKLKLVELSDKTCKWPIGDPLTDEFCFCGHDSDENSPYCSYHARLAFQPAAERRKR